MLGALRNQILLIECNLTDRTELQLISENKSVKTKYKFLVLATNSMQMITSEKRTLKSILLKRILKRMQ